MILVTGANGQLGQCFHQAAANWPDQTFLFLSSQELDISDRPFMRNILKYEQPNWVINCAAYTAVDKAESEPENVRKINVLGTKNLAETCAEMGISVPTMYTIRGRIPHTSKRTPSARKVCMHVANSSANGQHFGRIH